jgi:hypothetical protein
MAEISDSGANSTSKCSDTTGGNTPNTLAETAKTSVRGGKRTRSKRHASDMNAFSGKYREPPPRILVNELALWTFKSGETSYQADDTEHMFAWMKFVSDWADIKNPVDWEDLETRAHFLNMLYAWCEQNKREFPLQEKPENFTATLNFSGDNLPSLAN